MTGRDLIPTQPLGDAPNDPKLQDPRILRQNQAKVERGFWTKLRRSFGRVPFLEEAVSAYYCAFDPRTPRPVKAMLLGALAYFVVPSDLIPDFVAGLGFTDDATVLFATVRIVAAHITDAHRAQARLRLAQLGLREQPAATTEPGSGDGI